MIHIEIFSYYAHISYYSYDGGKMDSIPLRFTCRPRCAVMEYLTPHYSSIAT